MPHLHLSSLVTKKKIETGVIFFHSTSRLCTYPYLAHLLYIIKCVPHCPVHTAAAPDPTDVAAGKTGTPTEHPRRPTQHPPPAANHLIATTPNVGAPFMTPVARQGEALRAWGGTMVFPVAVIENSVATTGFSVRAIGFSVGAGNVRIAPSAIFPTPSAVSSGLRARLVVRGGRFRASMCRPRRADESVAMP